MLVWLWCLFSFHFPAIEETNVFACCCWTHFHVMPTIFCVESESDTPAVSIVYHTFTLKRSTFPWIHIVVVSQFSLIHANHIDGGAAEQHHFPLQRKDKYLISFIFVRFMYVCVCVFVKSSASNVYLSVTQCHITIIFNFNALEFTSNWVHCERIHQFHPKYTRTHTIATHQITPTHAVNSLEIRLPSICYLKIGHVFFFNYLKLNLLHLLQHSNVYTAHFILFHFVRFYDRFAWRASKVFKNEIR